MHNHTHNPTPQQEIEWRDIPKFEGEYQVSNTGLIRRSKAMGRYAAYAAYGLLHLTTHRQGYLEVKLRHKDGRKCILVHRLVMFAFVGECPQGMEVNHIDGNKANNTLSNLEYVTPKTNTRHAMNQLGRRAPQGSKHGRAKLDDNKVRDIRWALAEGASVKGLAKYYAVSQPVISAVRDRKTWKHVE